MSPEQTARHHRRNGDYALALACVRDEPGALARAEEARARHRLGQGRAALAAARAAVSLDPEGLDARLALAECLLGQGELAEARSLMEGIHAEEGRNLLDQAVILDQLSAIRQAQGEPAAAIGLSTRALATLEAIGADLALRAQALLTLAEAQHRAGAYPAALASYEALLRLRARLDGDRPHPERAAALDGRALTLRRLGRFAAAVAGHREAQQQHLACFGPWHPALAASHQGLAQALRRMGDFTGAKAHLEQALAVSERACGLDHTDTWVTRFELGRMVVDCGDPEGGFAQMADAHAVVRARLGASHPTVQAMAAWL